MSALSQSFVDAATGDLQFFGNEAGTLALSLHLPNLLGRDAGLAALVDSLGLSLIGHDDVTKVKARMVPLHSHLIEQGFTALAKEGDETPLFYDPKAERKGSHSHPLHKQMGGKLATWVRGLGVTEVESPNHGWRHRFKTQGRQVKMDAGALDAIQGHAPKTQRDAYGEWAMETLRAEVEKLGRYSC